MHPSTIAAILSAFPALAAAFVSPSSSSSSRLSITTKAFPKSIHIHHHNHDHNVPSNSFPRSTSTTSLQMGLLDLSWGGKSSSSSSSSTTQSSKNNGRGSRGNYNLEIENEIGSGSYGTVHLCRLLPKKSDDDENRNAMTKIAKRAWTERELLNLSRTAAEQSSTGAESIDSIDLDKIKEQSERCRYYIDVERHCLDKLALLSNDDDGDDTNNNADDVKKYVPNLIGVYPDNESNEWLVFDIISPDGSRTGTTATTTTSSSSSSSSSGPVVPMVAPTLSDILAKDWIDQHERDVHADPTKGASNYHHLYVLQKAFGMKDETTTFGDVLDKVFVELLRAVSSVNSNNIVHRDVKPGNLLVHSGVGMENNGDGNGDGDGSGSFILIDFGSAADMTPQSSLAVFGGNGGRVGLDSEGRVALSPIYAAPEVFVKPDRSPLDFDSFSAALVFAQLLFNLLDETADASFRQQLEDCDFSLDAWLKRELTAELQPDGMEDAVEYLAVRPGVWGVMRDMLHRDPERRISTLEALKRVERILGGKEIGVIEEADGKFFAEVVELFDQCELPDSGSTIGVDAEPPVAAASTVDDATMPTSLTERALVTPHPLHYIATFKRSESLGILLSEVDPEGEYDDDLSEEDAKLWKDATATALPGEVYVRGTVAGGQAEDIGILGVGDKLNGVGEFPFKAEGFDTVVEMLQSQPRSANTVTLHFGRKSVGRSHSYERTEPHRAKVEGQGAFQLRGKRKTQEDRFILHEVQDGSNAALLTGVFDGHGGDAASISLAQLMPSLMSVELAGITSEAATTTTTTTVKSTDLRDAMESAYEIACRTYRQGCDDEGLCIADYDPREGIVIAGTGASDLVAGSTVAMSCLSVAEDGAGVLSVLNCGDSRTLAVGRPRGGLPKDSVVYFSTRDHSPACEIEMDRLALGINDGYSQPECSMSRWRLKVGDYQYALARSLEGSFATSKGIVSDPDISTVNLSEMLAERELCSVILASDGLFEVIDNEQAGRYAIQWREAGLSADEVAKQLCRKAVDLGTPDNISVVVLYLS